MPVQRDRLQAGDLEIDLEVILQVGADTPTVGQHVDARRFQHLRRADPGPLENLR